MAKMLAQKDWDFNNIGSIFELDEIIPVYETEHRADENGEVIKDRDGKPKNFQTDKIIGYNYSVTILEPPFKKKSTQVKVLEKEPIITNSEIMKCDSVKVKFMNLETSMIGNPMYYKASDVVLLDNK